MYLFLAGIIAVSQPANPDPDFVTTTGLNVFDPAHLTTKVEVDFWILATLTLANYADAEELLARLPGAVLIIFPESTIPDGATPCDVPAGFTLYGCTSVPDQAMVIAWRQCGMPRPSAGIFGHEMGHLLGYPHSHQPWYLDNRMAVLAEALVCP